MHRVLAIGLLVVCLTTSSSAAGLARSQLILPQQTEDQSQNCQLCIAAVTLGEGFLIGSGEMQNLIKIMTDKICSEFGSDRQQECTELVPAVAAGAIQWARTHWPVEKICQDVQLCDASALVKSEVAAMMSESSAMLQSTTAPLQSNGLQDDECDTCELVVTQVASMLRNPETQKDILEYAHEACHSFPGFETQCETYVNMYGPLVLGIIQQYLQPETMCARLGFCPKPPALP